MDKSQMRREIKSRLIEIEPQQRAQKSKQICQHLLGDVVVVEDLAWGSDFKYLSVMTMCGPLVGGGSQVKKVG